MNVNDIVNDIMSTSSFRKFGGASNSNIWDADEPPMIQTHNGDSGYQPELSNELTVGRHTDHANFPGHTTSPGRHRKTPGHGVPEQLSPGHGLTTRIAQLRRELGARGAELETAKEQLAKTLGQNQMLKAEVADKDVKQQMAKTRNKRRIVDDQLAELYDENQSFKTIVRRQRRAIKEAELDSKEYIDEFEEIKKEKKKQKLQEKELRVAAANLAKKKQAKHRKLVKLKRKLQSLRQRKLAKENPEPISTGAVAGDFFSGQRSVLLAEEASARELLSKKTKRLKQKFLAQVADLTSWKRTEDELDAQTAEMEAQIVSSRTLVDRLLRQHTSLQILKDEPLETSQSSDTSTSPKRNGSDRVKQRATRVVKKKPLRNPVKKTIQKNNASPTRKPVKKTIQKNDMSPARKPVKKSMQKKSVIPTRKPVKKTIQRNSVSPIQRRAAHEQVNQSGPKGRTGPRRKGKGDSPESTTETRR